MARNTPSVIDGWLHHASGEAVQVGSSRWWEWLHASRVFRFEGKGASFTARKERRANGWYWYAYKRHKGKLRCVYIGASQDLTQERLSQVGNSVAAGESATPAEPPNPIYSNPLLLTKLRPPVLRRKLVPRPALTRRLESGLGGKLTLISAPAGSGKTTLLVEWTAQTELPVAWLSLDLGDNDLGRFMPYLIAALQGIRPELGETALPILRGPQVVPTEPAMTVLVNSIASVPYDFILVLDDYHLTRSEAVHSAMSFLLSHAPPQMHLVIASRTDPPLPLAQLRAHGQLTELRAPDLSFTHEETARFLHEVMELPASSEEVAALERRTEGWVAGLQLAALSWQLREGGLVTASTFTGSHRHLLDYLAAEVLEQQPPHVQDFLLRTSILDNLTAALCEALTDDGLKLSSVVRRSSSAQAMLEHLERANLFLVPLDERQEWYRYHPLFAEFLRSYLERSMPGEIEKLHLRTALWLREHGFAPEAVPHALAAREYELSASIIEQLAQTMLTHGENTTLIGWLDALPEEVMLARPRLCIYHAWAATYTGQLHVAERRANDAERAADEAGGTLPDESRGEIAAIRARLAANSTNLEQVLELSREALEHLPSHRLDLRGHVALNLGLAYMDFGAMEQTARYLSEAQEIGRASGNLRLAIFGLRYLGVARMVQGRLHEAARLYRRALEVATQGREDNRPRLPAVGVVYAGLGRLLYEWNYLHEAREYALRGIELGKRGGERKILLEGYTVLGKALNALGDTEGSFEAMDRMVETGGGTDWGHRTRLWLAHGRVREAARWMQEMGLSKDVKPFYSDELEHLTAARVLIAQGSTEDALYLLDKLLQAAEVQGRLRSVIEVLVVQAVAFQAQGRTDRARHSLERALSLAAPERFVRMFVDEGKPIADLLEVIYSDPQPRHRVDTHIPEDYLHSLLSAFGRMLGDVTSNGRYSQPVRNLLPEPLTRRETAVLRLMSAGMSNSQIADELVVGVGTVKTHALGIYGKLNARNRTQAVARARELGLI